MNEQEFIGALREMQDNIVEYAPGTFDRDKEDIFIIRAATFGDYDSSCHVERANLRDLRERFPEFIDVRYDAYNSKICHIAAEIDWSDTVIREKAAELIDVLNALHDYPAIDDETCSAVESEMVSECIDQELRCINRDIEDEFNGAITITDDKLREWIDDILYNDDDGRLTPRIESGGNVYINWDKVRTEIIERIREASICTLSVTVPQSVIDAVERNDGTACPIEWLSTAHAIAEATARNGWYDAGEPDIDGMITVDCWAVTV